MWRSEVKVFRSRSCGLHALRFRGWSGSLWESITHPCTSRVPTENTENRYVCARWAATKTTNRDPIIVVVVHLDKRAAPKESYALCRGVVIEFIWLPRADRRMFTRRRDFWRLGWYLFIYRARYVIYGHENVRCTSNVPIHIYVSAVYTYLHTYIRNPKLQNTEIAPLEIAS